MSRIALVGPLPPPAGGMANQTLQLARLLGEDGIAVDVVQVNRPYKPAWIGRVRVARALARLLPYLVALWRTVGRSDLVHVMANSGWAWHLFAAPAIRIAALRGRPVVVNYRGGEAPAFLARAGSVRRTLRRSAAVVVPSRFLHDVFASHGVSSRIVPNIVDVARFGIPGQRTAGPSARMIVTRNLERIYDLPTALRAFALVQQRRPEATLAIAGTGPERETLEGLATELGVRERVEFTGRLDPVEIAELCARADLMLNPARVDNMPNSILEGLAAGVPIVTTNVGGIPFIVEHEHTALLVAAGDAQAMAQAALRLLDDATLRERLRANGREAARQYTWPRIRPLWLGLYQELLGSRCAVEATR
jgi:glycosyltransferase involved in cell wall biosynthesis